MNPRRGWARMIAEKLHARVFLDIRNNRMKDFDDIEEKIAFTLVVPFRRVMI